MHLTFCSRLVGGKVIRFLTKHDAFIFLAQLALKVIGHLKSLAQSERRSNVDRTCSKEDFVNEHRTASTVLYVTTDRRDRAHVLLRFTCDCAGSWQVQCLTNGCIECGIEGCVLAEELTHSVATLTTLIVEREP